MGWFSKSLLGRVAKGTAREISKEFTPNKDFLEACCAAAALMAACEGGATPAEKQTAITVVCQNPTLGKVYDRTLVEQYMTDMLAKTDTSSGRFTLGEEMADILKLEGGPKMAVYVMLIAKDVAESDGTVGPKEKALFEKLCKRLNVDASQFEWE